MNLNVKSDEARRMARELAQATGQTITAAVTDAIREQLSRTSKARATADDLLAIGRDCAARLPEDLRTMPADALLYGEDGMPA